MWVKPSLRLVCAIPHIPQRRHLQLHKGSLVWVIRLPHSCKHPLMTEWCGMEGPCAFHTATSKKHKHSRQAPTLPWNSFHVMGIMHCTALIRSHELQAGVDTMMLSCSVPLVSTHINPEYSSITPFQTARHLNWAPVSCLNPALKGKHFGEKNSGFVLSSVFLETEYMRKLKPGRSRILETLILMKWRKLRITSMKSTLWDSYHLFCVKILWHLKLQKVLTMTFSALCLCGTETSFPFWRCAK